MSSDVIDCKVVMLGNSHVGKTCVLTRFLDNSFGHTQSTIGASYFKKALQYNNKTYKLGLWDTAGQERYDSLSSFYCRGAGCAIVAFDLTDKDSFENVPKWVKKLNTSSPAENCFIVLVATKFDLVESSPLSRRVPYEAAKEMAEKIGAIAYVESSSMTGYNIDTVFQKIIAKHVDIVSATTKETSTHSVELSNRQVSTATKQSCC